MRETKYHAYLDSEEKAIPLWKYKPRTAMCLTPSLCILM